MRLKLNAAPHGYLVLGLAAGMALSCRSLSPTRSATLAVENGDFREWLMRMPTTHKDLAINADADSVNIYQLSIENKFAIADQMAVIESFQDKLKALLQGMTPEQLLAQPAAVPNLIKETQVLAAVDSLMKSMSGEFSGTQSWPAGATEQRAAIDAQIAQLRAGPVQTAGQPSAAFDMQRLRASLDAYERIIGAYDHGMSSHLLVIPKTMVVYEPSPADADFLEDYVKAVDDWARYEKFYREGGNLSGKRRKVRERLVIFKNYLTMLNNEATARYAANLEAEMSMHARGPYKAETLSDVLTKYNDQIRASLTLRISRSKPPATTELFVLDTTHANDYVSAKFQPDAKADRMLFVQQLLPTVVGTTPPRPTRVYDIPINSALPLLNNYFEWAVVGMPNLPPSGPRGAGIAVRKFINGLAIVDDKSGTYEGAIKYLLKIEQQFKSMDDVGEVSETEVDALRDERADKASVGSDAADADSSNSSEREGPADAAETRGQESRPARR